MFSRHVFSRRGDFNARRFWVWFAAEANGLRNGLEALARGEADAGLFLAQLNARIRRFDARMEADLDRAIDGTCELHLIGATDNALAVLREAEPTLPGWRIVATAPAAVRVAYRMAPRPSLDLGLRIEARHEAYA